MDWLNAIDPKQPILLAGPTASGKSSLALRLAEQFGGVIVNADALQVYDCWNSLSARPEADDLRRAPHLLYGHIRRDMAYSVGIWLREMGGLLAQHRGGPMIVVGGTGLYFHSITNGLADIPKVSHQVRTCANHRMQSDGIQALLAELDRLDPRTAQRIDRQNPVRVQRAWEVLQSTGKGLADWQDATPPALVPLSPGNAFVLDAPKDWLTPRIEKRFDLMLKNGAIAECEAVLPDWNPARPWAKAIGAPELIAYLQGQMNLDQAIENAKISSRQYAKRQRSWFRARMKGWTWLPADRL